MVLEALKALQYEGPKSEAAQNFKEQGNECVQARQWSDAREFYTKGLAVLQSKDEGKWDQPQDPVEEEKLRRILTEQLYANRARCNLELSMASILHLESADRSRKLPLYDLGLWRCASGQSEQRQSTLSFSVSTIRTG